MKMFILSQVLHRRELTMLKTTFKLFLRGEVYGMQ